MTAPVRPYTYGGVMHHAPAVTPGPVPPHPDTAPTAPPPRLDPHEKMRMRAAGYRAKQLYPGPVGKLIERELLVWEELGYRFDKGGQVAALVDHVMKSPMP